MTNTTQASAATATAHATAVRQQIGRRNHDDGRKNRGNQYDRGSFLMDSHGLSFGSAGNGSDRAAAQHTNIGKYSEIRINERYGQNQRVETVEKSAVTGDAVSRILQAGRALEHRLDQIAQYAGDSHHETRPAPQQSREPYRPARVQAVQPPRTATASTKRPREAFQDFLGNPLRQPVPAEQRPAA